jgi:magnesium transporter
MIVACLDRKTLETHEITTENRNLLLEAAWIDLLSPTKDEEFLIELFLSLNVPTREEMIEIELSSRLYKDNGTLYMTAAMIAQSDSPEPELDPVTFVLTQKHLITIRYVQPQAFNLMYSHLKKLDTTHHDAVSLFIELLDVTVDRLADIIELVGRRLDEYSKTIFRAQRDAETKLDYLQLLQTIGANGDLNSKARESLITFNRLIAFFGDGVGTRLDSEGRLRITTLSKDITSLSDHVNFLSSKVNFLLDATLGMVSTEQNNIIKIFSVAAVIFLPPTLVASIYGMNFHMMPELSWKYGYLFAIGFMLLAAWLPYKYFKHRKWL